MAALIADLLKSVQIFVGGCPHEVFRSRVLLGEDGQAVGITDNGLEGVQFWCQGWTCEA